jgi:hypothetical protein
VSHAERQYTIANTQRCRKTSQSEKQ